MTGKLSYLKIFIIALVPLFSAYAAEANIDFTVKAAIVDVQAVLENAACVQKMRGEIGQISENIQQEMSKKEAELKKIEQELINKKGVLSEDAFKKEVDKLNEKVTAAQKNMQSRKEGLEKAHADAMQQIHEATIEIISQLAGEKNFNMAIPSSQVLFAREYLNITSEVITRLNEKQQTVKVNYMDKK